MTQTAHGIHPASTALPCLAIGLSLTIATPLTHATIAQPDEVVVTARRTEEVIQNVPISMTVFNQDMLNERNVTNGADLVAYTPSLSVNSRFGSDQASFAIRGFTQDVRTTASVAVYFADVVAPRGGGNITAGDGAGPGAFFDLQNVQVLKGPQGTLFGRNTTGGAIQLVPQEPTGKLEGYLELSAGNFNMRRSQGVLNLPINDQLRARFGIDSMRRDGYIENTSGIGPDRFSDVDYFAGRGSLFWDITDAVTNYTIFTYANSENNGTLQAMFACNDDLSIGFASFCTSTLAHQGDGFYKTESAMQKPSSKLRQWQAINTTAWDVSEAITLKNILSYAHLRQDLRSSVQGTNFHVPMLGWPLEFFPSYIAPGAHSNNQSTLVEELQFSGSTLNDKLSWQAGLYYESSRPDGWSGSQSPGTLSCLNELGADPANWVCADPLRDFAYMNYFGTLPPSLAALDATIPPIGTVERSLGKTEYNNQAIYAQGTYDLSDEFRLTLGLRYTVDETKTTSKRTTWFFPDGILQPPGAPLSALTKCSLSDASLVNDCIHRASTKSEAPTWLIDVDYLPSPDVMLYAKYSRGYRQGSIVYAAPPSLDLYDPEKVDAYEIGAKTSFRSAISGTFNIALFYNELSDQQLQLGYIPTAGGSATTAVLNAGASTIQGAELETTLKLIDDLSLNLAYTYLSTRLDSFTPPAAIAGWQPIQTVEEGGHLTFSPRHTVVAGLSYRLPLPAEIGEVSAGGTYTFTDSQDSTSGSKYGTLPSHRLLNLNLGWKSIFGSGFDTAFFVTNALNEKYRSYVPGFYERSGFEASVQAEPRMWGARIKYTFD
ncbi:MAG: TonB-dependent receptor [Spongiibacteraceae bacterium]